jgi:hypothetical protein
MATEKFIQKKFRGAALDVINRANALLEHYYHEDGIIVTLRQLYYRFVAKGWIENTLQSYKALGTVISEARLAGLIDWQYMQDLTRNVEANAHWRHPASIVNSAASSYAEDKWAGQEYRVEVWVEKDALRSVVAPICRQLDVPYFVCRGYTSQSEMYAASKRLLRYANANGATPVILHLGDHDPSGMDMTRDVTDRLEMFTRREGLELTRLALNMDQVQQYDPPANPAKVTDSRAQAYIARFGRSSWELDALEPTVLTEIIRSNVLRFRDEDLFNEREADEADNREKLKKLATHYSSLEGLLELEGEAILGFADLNLEEIAQRPEDVSTFLRTGFDGPAIWAIHEDSNRLLAAGGTSLEAEDFESIREGGHEALVRQVLKRPGDVAGYLAFLDMLGQFE